MDKRLSAEQLRRALQLLVASLTEDKAMEIASVYPAWETTRAYAVGDIVSYGTNSVGDPQLYKVVQAHTSQADWTPDAAPALYDAFGLDDAGYPLWAQPSGAHDAYNVGDIVNYNGTLYESIISGNVWSPDVYPAGWQLVESGGGTEPEEPATYPDWVQPTGAHDAYNKGDIVSYKGTLYRSLVDGNTWSPDTYPAGWEVVQPAVEQ